MTESPLPIAARRAALDAYSASYKEIADNWRAIDAKAQTVITVAGMFIAGAVALARDEKALVDATTKITLIIVVLLLIVTVLVAADVLRVRDVDGPIPGDELEQVARDLDRRLHTSSPESVQSQTSVANSTLEFSYLSEVGGLWRNTLEVVSKHHHHKARRLLQAQRLLVASVLAGGALTILQVLLPWIRAGR